MLSTTSISQIKRDISQLVNRVTYGGERIILTSRGRPKAALVSLADLQRLLAPGDAAEERARELAILDQARAIRAQIAARVGGLLPDSALELQELREERDEQLCGLR